MTVELRIDWPLDVELLPRVALTHPHLPFDDVEIEVPLDRAYAWLDAGQIEPAASVLLPQQVALLDRFLERWPAMQGAIAAHYPKRVRPFLRWTGLRVTDRVKGDDVAWGITGTCDAPFDHAYEEHGIGAVLLGDEVLAAGDRDPGAALPRAYAAPTAPRPHPGTHQLSQDLTERLAARDLDGVETLMAKAHGVGSLKEVVFRWLLSQPVEEVLDDLPRLTRLIAGYPGWPVDEVALRRDPKLLLALVRRGCYTLPRRALHDASDPESLRRWRALGAPLNTAVRPDGTPLEAHRHRPDLFETLLELGADPSCLVDEYGKLIVDLGPLQHAALRRHHPDLQPVERERASDDLLSTWLDHRWIALSPGADASFANRLLEGILDRTHDPAVIGHALRQVPGVEAVLVDEETLRAWLATRRG